MLKRQSTEISPTSGASRAVNVSVFLIMALLWGVFIQSALEQKSLTWFPLLLGARTLLLVFAVVLAVTSWIRPRRHWIVAYLTVCLSFQAIFACFEGSQQLEYYQYIAYFVLLAALSFQGSFRSWLTRIAPIHALALIAPLFTKDPIYFRSVGAFAFQFTTPVALSFLSVLIVRVAAGKFEALQANLALREELLQVNQNAKEVLAAELKAAREQIENESKRSALVEVNLQVAHNIRSPLAALELKLQEITIQPDAKRREIQDSVRRIRDIANELVWIGQKQRREGEITPVNASKVREPLSETYLPALVDSLVSEKRLEYRSRQQVSIRFEMSPGTYGSFALVQPNELRQALSNLVNNSVEALPSTGGVVEVRLRPGPEEGITEIHVQDDGRGISDAMLLRLGEKGATQGKQNGLGVGIYHAREALQRWGGLLKAERISSHGTMITLRLPQIAPPSWFAPSLGLLPSQSVVVVDDDTNFQQVWRSKIRNRRIHYLSGSEALKNFLDQTPSARDHFLFLIDYDLGKIDENGLDIIESNGIASRALLVTSHFDQPEVQQRAFDELQIQIVPKQFAIHINFDLKRIPT